MNQSDANPVSGKGGKSCRLILDDEVNCRFEGLDVDLRKRISGILKYKRPGAEFTARVKMGFWDGYDRFFSVGGRTYINLLDRALPLIEEAGYEVELIDNRVHQGDIEFQSVDADMFGGSVWPKGHKAEGLPIILRDYQVEIVNKYLENPQSIQEITTGAGKTLTCAAISKQIEGIEFRGSPGRSLIIVPNKNLVGQTEEVYRTVGLDVGVYRSGANEEQNEAGHRHTIATWQTLKSLKEYDLGKERKGNKDNKGNKEIRRPLQDFEDVACVIVDEVHTSKNNQGVLKDLLTSPPLNNTPIRWGMTGTIPKEETGFATLLSGVGPVVHKLTAKELQDEGALSQCNINIMQLRDDDVAFADFAGELSYLVGDGPRLEFIANIISEIVTDEGNTLVLIDRIKTGQELERLIPDAVFVDGSMKSDKRKEHYDMIDDEDNKVIVATYGVAAVGINIPRIFNVVLIEPGKSFVRVIQSIGRGLRTARDSNEVEIWDIASTTKFSDRHLTKRKQYYKDAKYPFEEFLIDWK